jgi:hypothetical protein
MKNYFVILELLFLILFFVQPEANAQRKTEPRKPQRTVVESTPQNVLKINPLSLFTLTTNVSYERVINSQMSGQLGFFYTFPSVTIANTQFRGFGITPEFRYYFAAIEAPKGFYVASFLRYQRFTLTYDNPESSQYNGEAIFRATGVGATVGGQWLFGNGFTVDAFFGLAANSFNIRTDVPGLSDKIKIPIAGAVTPRLGITIGKAF